MGWNNHVDFELHELISDAVDESYIEVDTPAYGIAQQLIHQGYNSLTVRQKVVYDDRVFSALKRFQKMQDAKHRRELLERDDYIGFTTSVR
jgi:hypothetical protein